MPPENNLATLSLSFLICLEFVELSDSVNLLSRNLRGGKISHYFFKYFSCPLPFLFWDSNYIYIYVRLLDRVPNVPDPVYKYFFSLCFIVNRYDANSIDVFF